MSHIDDILTQKANLKFVSKAMKYPLLTLKKEKELTKLWSKRKDVKSLHILINSYEKLVVSTAIKFRKFGLPFGDLLQEGNIGILKAAYKFDTNIDVRFSTYARWWIKSSIQEFVLKNWSIVRIGSTTTQKLLFFQLSRLKNKIENSSYENNGSETISEKIAKDLRIKISDVEKISERVIKKDLLLDHAFNNEDDNRTPLDFLNDNSLNPYEITLKNDTNINRKKVIAKSLKALNDKEKHIILRRHLNSTPLTLESIGKELKISKERVRQLEGRAFIKLKKRILKTDSKQDLI
ncbi:MAG: RNA polymerase sigma factor RpoH [Alphaproteobacteria bacterium MarineAlpha6_Bin3]|nr:MAG: RNA polymerase sigma factor RpoH [Alphaproteobacteria bacterium MarineAlpha6_Bin3]|tara:strand:- start:7985 stop:8863 length:879 start_codon:yes stop_codon:yes gene_type:complete